MICRTYLFVPGNRPDRFEKAQQSGAGAVILDLEDAVQSTQKDLAREAVASWLSPERPVYVRINGTSTLWFERDLEVVCLPGVLGVGLPKAEQPEQVAEVGARLIGEARVLPLLETALGVWNARALAQAPRVERLAFGSVDFQLDTSITGEQEELLYARSRLRDLFTCASMAWTLSGLSGTLRWWGCRACSASSCRRRSIPSRLPRSQLASLEKPGCCHSWRLPWASGTCVHWRKLRGWNAWPSARLISN